MVQRGDLKRSAKPSASYAYGNATRLRRHTTACMPLRCQASATQSSIGYTAHKKTPTVSAFEGDSIQAKNEPQA